MDFEPHRPRLTVLAYQMLGSVQAAEDVVQDAWLRFERASPRPHSPGWLRTVVARLCLDELKSARARRETYPGPWLPEPWVDGGVDLELERAHDLSLALLTVLERLPPRQRVAFVLREALDVDTADLADTLDTTSAGVRQLLRRARAAVRAAEPTTEADPERQAQVLEAYGAALSAGDAGALARLLSEDAVLLSDGGGVVRAAKVPVVGRARIARALVRLARFYPPDVVVHPLSCNQRLAVGLGVADLLVGVVWLGVRGGRIVHVWSQLEPRKLARLAGHLGLRVLDPTARAPVSLERLLGQAPLATSRGRPAPR